MPTKYVKAIMESGLLSGGDMAEYAMKLYRWIAGSKNVKAESAKIPSSPPGPQVISENREQEGELYALLAWLSTLYMADGTCALEYKVAATEAHIFPKVVAALPPGAIKRLMQTVAVEVTTIKRKKTTGFTQHKDPKDPTGQRTRETPIVSEWDEKLNQKGAQVISALTWLVTSGKGAEAKRIKAVAETLQSLHILDNLEDKAAVAAKAAADKASAFGTKVVGWCNDHETGIHIGLAEVAIGKENVARILAGRPAQELLAAIDAAPETEKQGRRNAFQAFLLALVKQHQDPAIKRHEAREAGRMTAEEKDKRLTRIFVITIVVGVIILGVAAKFN